MKLQIIGSRVSDAVGVRWSPRSSTSANLPGNADSASSGTTVEESQS
jgi:hypothetical protein